MTFHYPYRLVHISNLMRDICLCRWSQLAQKPKVECSALSGTSIPSPFLPRHRDYCRRKGKKAVRVKTVDDHKEKKCLPDIIGQLHVWTHSGNGCQRMHKAINPQAGKLPGRRGEGRNEIPPLDEEVLVTDGYWEMENQFSLMA